MTYTIRLIGLECFVAQEMDGDEIYVKLNDLKVWAAHPDRMTHVPTDDHHVNQFDFATGRRHTHSGWTALPAYNPEAFIYRAQSGRSVLQLWDADAATRDDLLGETPIDQSQASGGSISVVFRRAGAHYRLTYKVER